VSKLSKWWNFEVEPGAVSPGPPAQSERMQQLEAWAQSTVRPGLQLWEYCYLVEGVETPQHHGEVLNIMGAAGWELVGFDYETGNTVVGPRMIRYVFKRPAP
jgi:hypothetical protein